MTTDFTPDSTPDPTDPAQAEFFAELSALALPIPAQSTDPVEPIEVEEVITGLVRPTDYLPTTATILDRIEKLESELADVMALLSLVDTRLTTTLELVDKTLVDVKPFLDGFGQSKIGKMLGLGEDTTKKDDTKPTTKRGFF